MTEYMTALYDSAFSTWLREAETVWAFPTVLTVHTFGMMLLVGCAWVVDLRLLGIARSIPIGPLRQNPEPVLVTGSARQLAAASALLWAGTIFAGRLLGYM